MAITRVGQGTGTNTATLPTLAIGDLIVVGAYRDGSTVAPTVPTAFSSGVVTTGGSNTNSMVVAALEVTTGSETVGTWTNATSLIAVVYRGVFLDAPGGSVQSGGASTTMSYGTITVQDTTGGNCLVAFGGHRSTNVAIDTVPTNFSLVTSVSDATDEMACFERFSVAAGSTALGSVNVGGTSSGYRTAVFELLPAAGGNYSITVTPGAVTTAGASVNPKAARKVSVTAASVAVAGATINPVRGVGVSLTPASITVTGASITPKVARKVSITAAAVSIAGASVSVKAARKVSVTPAAVTVAGSEIVPVYAGGGEPEPEQTQRDSDVIWRKFVPEIPRVEEIEEALEQEAAKPRPKTRKVKREIAQQIIDMSNVGALLGEKIPPAVYRQIERAFDAFEAQEADLTLLYTAIRFALIRAAEEAEEEDDMMAILMVA